MLPFYILKSLDILCAVFASPSLLSLAGQHLSVQAERDCAGGAAGAVGCSFRCHCSGGTCLAWTRWVSPGKPPWGHASECPPLFTVVWCPLNAASTLPPPTLRVFGNGLVPGTPCIRVPTSWSRLKRKLHVLRARGMLENGVPRIQSHRANKDTLVFIIYHVTSQVFMEQLTFLSHRWTLSHSPDLSGLKKKCLCPQKVVKSCPKGSERLVRRSGTAAALTPPAASPSWPGSAGSRAEGLQCRREVPVHPPARDPISTWAFTWGWISPTPRKALFAFLTGISQAH